MNNTSDIASNISCLKTDPPPDSISGFIGGTVGLFFVLFVLFVLFIIYRDSLRQLYIVRTTREHDDAGQPQPQGQDDDTHSLDDLPTYAP